MLDGLIIDNFAGGGGASTGIKMACGRDPDYAINHDANAIAMHRANHPDTVHYSNNIWKVDPRIVTRGRKVALAWFSPDCKHFSRAKGKKPVSKNIRDLAWTVVTWAKVVRPSVILLENVTEFQGWGPLGDDGEPDKAREGETFKKWVRALRRLGYNVEWKPLRASDFGVPTLRERLFVVARCDGRPIVWPQPTHGDPAAPQVQAGKLLPWRTAGEIIDWSIPCPSIFLTKEEARLLGIRRPLQPSTLQRIARGMQRYVINAPEPYIVSLTHHGRDRIESLDRPAMTVTAAKRGENALIVPHLTKFRTGSTGAPMSAPMPTVTANSYVKRPGGAPPIGAVQAFLEAYGNKDAQPTQMDLFGEPSAPGTGPEGVIATHMLNLKGSSRRDAPMGRPVNTVCSGGGHVAEVAAFLTKYYSSGESTESLDEPLHTVTSKDRFTLITVMIGGEPYIIRDIGMRMLSPRELYRAQGFPDNYEIDRGLYLEKGIKFWKPMTKTVKVGCCGNSVCPPLAAALVRAQFPEL